MTASNEVDVSQLKQGMRIAYTPPGGCRYEATVGQVSETGIRLVDRTLGDRKNIRRAVAYGSPRAKIRHIEILSAPGGGTATREVAASNEHLPWELPDEASAHSNGAAIAEGEPNGVAQPHPPTIAEMPQYEPLDVERTAGKSDSVRAAADLLRSLRDPLPVPPMGETEGTEAASAAAPTTCAGPTHSTKVASPESTWSDRIEWVNPASLRPHKLWGELFGARPDHEADEQLAEVARFRRGGRPMVVTGDNCASGRDVVLDDDRQLVACVATCVTSVPIIRRTSLTADDEEIVVLTEALASHHTRRLSESQLADIEDRLYHLYRRQPGTRTDLTQFDSNQVAGNTLTLIAEETGQPRSAIADRRKLYKSPVSSLFMAEAVEQGAMARSAAAAMVRDLEREPEVRSVVRQAAAGQWSDEQVQQHPVLRAARERLEVLAREQLNRPRRPPHDLNGGAEPEPTRINGEVRDGVFRAQAAYRRRQTRFEVEGTEIRVTDLGPLRRDRQEGG